MHVLPAKPQKQTLSQSNSKGPSGFKAEKEQERKATANSEHNWNSLFLNQDAVVASMQESHGLSKAEVLDPESSNMVRACMSARLAGWLPFLLRMLLVLLCCCGWLMIVTAARASSTYRHSLLVFRLYESHWERRTPLLQLNPSWRRTV